MKKSRAKKERRMGSKEQNQLSIPMVDFCGLDSNNPGGQGWDTARAQVMQALESHRCFEAVYNRVSSELREALLGRAVEDLFALPLEAKLRNTSEGVSLGYLSQLPNMDYESLKVNCAATLEGAQEFTNLMFPGKNPTFCNTVWTFSKHLQELAQMVHIMILQSLGIENYFDRHIESKTSGLRLSKYGVPLDQETKLALRAHTDPNMLTIICQHHVKGLEIQDRDGEWTHVMSSPNSFTVMIGEAFAAWTNGRLRPTFHRVKMIGNEKRYSAIFATRPSDDYMLQPLEELANEDHPLLFKPFNYGDYLRFRFSKEGKKYKDTLKAYCGVGTEVDA